jgi:hypothetical protein
MAQLATAWQNLCSSGDLPGRQPFPKSMRWVHCSLRWTNQLACNLTASWYSASIPSPES